MCGEAWAGTAASSYETVRWRNLTKLRTKRGHKEEVINSVRELVVGNAFTGPAASEEFRGWRGEDRKDRKLRERQISSRAGEQNEGSGRRTGAAAGPRRATLLGVCLPAVKRESHGPGT